jgi:alpha,alpha-trehalose phosphorylase
MTHTPDLNTADNEWAITETPYRSDNSELNATLFALGNGYIGIRGDFEECRCNHLAQGTFLNGVFTAAAITYGEKAFGYAEKNQSLASVANGRLMTIRVNGSEFSLDQGEVLGYRRQLSMATGQLVREIQWRSPNGETIELCFRRMVCQHQSNLAMLECEITALNFDGTIEVTSGLCARRRNPQSIEHESDEIHDPRAANAVDSSDYQTLTATTEEGLLSLCQQIQTSGFTVVAKAQHQVKTQCDWNAKNERQDDNLYRHFMFQVSSGDRVSLTKTLVYVASRERSASELEQSAVDCLQKQQGLNYSEQARRHQAPLSEFWHNADVQLDGNPDMQQGMRFSQFHLLQSVGRDGKTNIAAKGLSGDGYDGHYFWDTEIYILPFFLHSQPELARNLLSYRHSILDAARQRARQMAISKGALFPWRTIAGEECSAYYPAGTAQFHINADIAYAVKRYHQVTGDDEFMLQQGAEIVLESVRIWMELGHFNARRDGEFCIDGVTGPDEYTAVVNNNFFTNCMAQNHLQYAVELCQWLQQEYPERYEQLRLQLQLQTEEIQQWALAAEKMRLPEDAKTGVHAQDDAFFDKKVWDFANTPKENYPLLLHYHPLVIYRHQVCKQADVVLALFLLSEQFSIEQKRRDFDYYESITTHDSTLSACMHGILACELGYADKAMDYMRDVMRMDLDNHHHNTEYGVHTACMGGAWMSVVNGFAGMRVLSEGLSFHPRLPQDLDGYRFSLLYGGSRVEIKVDAANVQYRLLEGDSLQFKHAGNNITLNTRNPQQQFDLVPLTPQTTGAAHAL